MLPVSVEISGPVKAYIGGGGGGRDIGVEAASSAACYEVLVVHVSA